MWDILSKCLTEFIAPSYITDPIWGRGYYSHFTIRETGLERVSDLLRSHSKWQCWPRSWSVTHWALRQCLSWLVNFQMWCLISSKTAVCLLGPCHFWNPMMPCLDKTVKKHWRENSSHWRNRCWSVSVPISAPCGEERSMVTPGRGEYFSTLTQWGVQSLWARAFQGLGAQRFLCYLRL